MTCIKTGASVYYENYGYSVPADIYQINPETIIVRGNFRNPVFGYARTTDWVIPMFLPESVWHREDLGVTVLHADHILPPN